jgi:hypothetical protein
LKVSLHDGSTHALDDMSRHSETPEIAATSTARHHSPPQQFQCMEHASSNQCPAASCGGTADVAIGAFADV